MCGLAPRACVQCTSPRHMSCVRVSLSWIDYFSAPPDARSVRASGGRGGDPEPTRARFPGVPRTARRPGSATGPPAAVYRRLGVRRAHGLTIEHTVETFVLTLKVVRSHSSGEFLKSALAGRTRTSPHAGTHDSRGNRPRSASPPRAQYRSRLLARDLGEHSQRHLAHQEGVGEDRNWLAT